MPQALGGFNPRSQRPRLPRNALSLNEYDPNDSDGYNPTDEQNDDINSIEEYDTIYDEDDGHVMIEMGSEYSDNIDRPSSRGYHSDSLINEPDMIINLDDIRDARGWSSTADETNRDLNYNDIIGAADYDDAIDLDIEEPLSLPFELPDEEVIDDSTESPVHDTVGNNIIDSEVRAHDTSRFLPMPHNKNILTSRFEKSLATYADIYGISRDQWTSLREVLMLVKGIDGETPEDIVKLPRQLSTLIERFRKRLPLMHMREMTIPLKAENLPTEARTRRAKLIETMQLRKEKLEEQRTANVNNPRRTRVNEQDSNTDIEPIASTRLTFFDPPTVTRDLVSDETVQLHIGRILGFGYDLRKRSCTHQSRQLIALQVQPAFSSFNIRDIDVTVNPAIDDNELILSSDSIFIPETNAFGGLDVFMDHEYGECQDNPSSKTFRERRPGARQKDIRFPKYTNLTVPQKSINQYYYVRRIIRTEQIAPASTCTDTNTTDTNTVKHIIPLCHTHPIRAELEIEHYGRYTFEVEWDQSKANSLPVASLPVETFIDGFGIFSNSYRSLLGYYITPCGLQYKDRLWPGNIIPLVLGPHGSDFGDVVKGLGTLADLDIGVITEIGGIKTRLCVWTMVFIGDMPQQAENCGFKSPRADKFCRGCYISVGQKSFADPVGYAYEFDSITHGRYHHQVCKMQISMSQLGSKRDVYGSQWGMTTPHPALLTIAPALDIVMTRPYDPCHSEYNGLFNLSHFLFRDAIITPKAIDDYTLELRTFPLPPSARRLQSPKHHLSSYEMSAHAVWGNIITIFLRSWLKPSHLKPGVLDAASQYGNGNPVDVIISTFVNMTKSATVLMGYTASHDDYDKIDLIIRRGRESFNLLCYIASVGARSRAASRAGSQSGASQAFGSQAGSQDGSVLDMDIDGSVQAGSRLVHMGDTQRPNMHIGVHYHDFATEYAKTVNCNTLTGEDLHRYFKRRVYETNYSNIEKVLLMKLNSQLTIRLVLRNAFANEDPDLTTELQQLYKQCPNLYRRTLARTDRNEIEILQEHLSEFVLDVPPSADDTHVEPIVINEIPTTEVKRSSHRVQGDGPLPIRASDISTAFIHSLRSAYATDYRFPVHHPSAYEPSAAIKWSRKLAFNTVREAKDRFVYSRDDFICYHNDLYGQIDHIFVFNVWGIEHIFAIVTPIQFTGQVDPILKLKLMKQTNDSLIIGIPAIEPIKPYIIPLKDQFIYVNWEIKWL
ncbi:hypothetical protein GGS21DRAFT_492800 [Xylaria nigripes]|nr:hypothetical protein GGS21DRAFT_492800 [Xylaria nigripes]